MNKTYQLIQNTIDNLGYKILDDDGETITVFYQLNILHIIPDEQDCSFVTVFTSIGEKVTPENRGEVLEKCNKLTSKVKVMKFYVFEEEVLASSEFFFRNKNEVRFQLMTALNQLAVANTIYDKTRV